MAHVGLDALSGHNIVRQIAQAAQLVDERDSLGLGGDDVIDLGKLLLEQGSRLRDELAVAENNKAGDAQVLRDLHNGELTGHARHFKSIILLFHTNLPFRITEPGRWRQ